MFLNLNEIRGAHERVDEVYQAAAFAERLDDPDGFRVVGPVALGFDIYKSDEVFHLVGTLKGRVELQCSRCLEPFEHPVDTSSTCATSRAPRTRARESGRSKRTICRPRSTTTTRSTWAS